MPVFGVPMSNANQMHEATDVFVGFDNDVSTTPTVASIRTTTRNMGLAPKAA
jgi:hypothetical protein